LNQQARPRIQVRGLLLSGAIFYRSSTGRAGHDRLAHMGPLSLLRRHGRHERTFALEDIERFQGDVARATGKVERCERH